MLKAVFVVVAGISLACPLAYAGQDSQPDHGSDTQTQASQKASEDLPVEATVDCFYESNKGNDACQNAGANVVAVHSSSRTTGSH